MNSANARHGGVLLHLTSLPSDYGIGDLGRGAYRTADWISESALTLWQILPTGPTGYGNSPYAPRSSFAANELLIDLDSLVEGGLLERGRVDDHQPFSPERVDFTRVRAYKMPLLMEAAEHFITADGTATSAYRHFCAANAHWLDDYALFQTLISHFGDSRWMSHWPAEYADRDEAALARFKDENALAIERWRVLQYFFDEQFTRFRCYVNGLGIRLIGDVPIFVAVDSCDTWQHRHLFKRDSAGTFTPVSGVPPDIFSSTGQYWGNPVYDWSALEKSGYTWWIDRIRRLFFLTDMVRFDHFKGLEATYEIPAHHPTAEHGTWVKTGGAALFDAIRSALGPLDIIAEDLGLMNDEVIALRDGNNFPGMKILQFGFTQTEEGAANYHDDFLPHNWGEPFVAYTGTHDNNTTLGWYRSLSAQEREMVCTYLGTGEEGVVKAMIRALMLSHARIAIIPMQDVLEKGEEARFNYPSSCNEENWSWRVKESELDSGHARELAHLVTISARDGVVVPSPES